MANRVVNGARVCATEGCTRFLKSRWPHPDCPACRGESAEPPPRPPRPGTRVVHVPYATSYSGVPLSAAITMPAEPWSAR